MLRYATRVDRNELVEPKQLLSFCRNLKGQLTRGGDDEDADGAGSGRAVE
jgi:hypothetical protein